jgi:hypothetical protein
MPAWIAGIQIRRMRPETSMSTWVPAIHAGTTNVCRNVDLHKAAGRKRSVHPSTFERGTRQRRFCFYIHCKACCSKEKSTSCDGAMFLMPASANIAVTSSFIIASSTMPFLV